MALLVLTPATGLRRCLRSALDLRAAGDMISHVRRTAVLMDARTRAARTDMMKKDDYQELATVLAASAVLLVVLFLLITLFRGLL